MKHYSNISSLLSLESAAKKDGRKLLPEDLSLIHDASVVFDDQKIHWVGKTSEVPSKYSSASSYSFEGKTLTPEIVDSHTHAVFAGDRSKEYQMRLDGRSYEEIAKAGGGILSTVKSTLNASFETLYELAKARVLKISSKGIGTIEIKSGYCLDYEGEKRLSLVIDKLKKELAPRVQIKNTFMAAHAVPKSFASSTEYLKQIVLPLLKELAKKIEIDAVDIFHEQGYFSSEDVTLLFNEAKSLGIPVKSHADEFVDNKGALLASSHGAISTDHLLRTGPDGITAISKSSTVATLLPGTGFFLGKEQSNARGFLDQGAKVALASDYNPGSCHYDDLVQIAALSAPTLKLNSTELWCAITLNAAHALGIKNQGAIVKGLNPRFSLFDCDHPAKITYNWGKSYCCNHLLK